RRRRPMTCPRCRKASSARAKFCQECGARLAGRPGIVSSASDHGGLEPVLAAIARTPARLCDAKDALIYLVDWEQFRPAAKHGPPGDAGVIGYTLDISRGGPGGRAVLECRTVHVRDLAVAARTQFPNTRAWRQATGWRTVLATPLRRNGSAIGAILVLR